jgi:hypothetical protein
MKRWRMTGVAALGLILALAVVAYAHGGGSFRYGHPMGMGPMMEYGQGMNGQTGDSRSIGHCGNFRGRERWSLDEKHRDGSFQNMPDELRKSMEAIHRTRLELRLALTDKPLDEDKVRQLHGKILKLHDEMARWRFEQTLEQMREDKSPQ